FQARGGAARSRPPAGSDRLHDPVRPSPRVSTHGRPDRGRHQTNSLGRRPHAPTCRRDRSGAVGGSGAGGRAAERTRSVTRHRTVARKVVVVGAGIGGLTAALALLERSIDVEVYEQSNELKEVGAGIQISANGTRVLFALGLEAALARVQVRPERRELRHWSTGETWNWFDLGDKNVQRFGTPHLMLHRADLHDLLAGAVRAKKRD